jgi:hypothetical protein
MPFKYENVLNIGRCMQKFLIDLAQKKKKKNPGELFCLPCFMVGDKNIKPNTKFHVPVGEVGR